mgnify:CR=1 FL=1
MRYTCIIALLTSVSCCHVQLLFANKTQAESLDEYGVAYQVSMGAIHGVYYSPGHVQCKTAGCGVGDTPGAFMLFDSAACALTRSNGCVDVGIFRGIRYYMPIRLS